MPYYNGRAEVCYSCPLQQFIPEEGIFICKSLEGCVVVSEDDDDDRRE